MQVFSYMNLYVILNKDVGDCDLILVGVVVLIGDKSHIFLLDVPIIGDIFTGVVVNAGGVAGGVVFNIDDGIVFIIWVIAFGCVSI